MTSQQVNITGVRDQGDHHPAEAAAGRTVFIDMLRVICVAWLVPFHTARIYDLWEINYVKSGATSAGLSALIGLTGPWHMPFFFLLAGASTYLALTKRSGVEYARERTLRLLVPLLFGTAVLIPPQPYYALLDHGTPPSSYAGFLAGYFTPDLRDLSGYYGTFTPAHLWFILYLFLFSLLLLPLFLYLRKASGAALVSRAAALISSPAGAVLLVILLAATELLPAPGGKNPFFYGIFFLGGFLFMADERLRRAAETRRRIALATGLPAAFFVVAVWLSGPSLRGITPATVAFSLVRHYAGLALVTAALGYGLRRLDGDRPWLPFAQEISFPFYILHQTVIVAAGYYIIRLVPAVYTGFLAICALSFLVTAGLCAAARLTPVTRFLLGMKALRPRQYRT
ncbi:MAG TPA: acyltransferase [Spirochaetota bacterium]|nr:acyltransferase [Spirochaetota bacterium]HPV40383.1 acyltransferase [Spirochaetota bacterium]